MNGQSDSLDGAVKMQSKTSSLFFCFLCRVEIILHANKIKVGTKKKNVLLK